MNKDIDKTIIRIVQDYCFNSDAKILLTELIHTIVPPIVENIEQKNFKLEDLQKILQKRKDFFNANNIDLKRFCKELYGKINYELSFCLTSPFLDSMLKFKEKMENGNAQDFVKDRTNEGHLRSALDIYLNRKTYCEPRVGAGNCDIVVPDEKTIIETKIWKGQEYYRAGFLELAEYLKQEKYREGYYIIFDYNKQPNRIIKERGECFDIEYQNMLIHVIFIKMNPIAPSQLYKSKTKND